MIAGKVVRSWLTKLVALGRLVRFSHSVFALPFALMALFLAERSWPGWVKLFLITACMISARSAAMAFNRIVDVEIDAQNPRTRNRPLQTGRLGMMQAKFFWALMCVIFVIACGGFLVFFGNAWPLALSLPVLLFICVYSLTKRFTFCCHLWLGAALGLSPLATWLAVSPHTVGLPAVILGLTVMCWVSGFDIIYALQDMHLDRCLGLHSLPARFGPSKALWISRALHSSAIIMLILVGLLLDLGWIYRISVATAGILLLVQQVLVSSRDYSRAGAVFFRTNAAMSLFMAAGTILDVVLRAS